MKNFLKNINVLLLSITVFFLPGISFAKKIKFEDIILASVIDSTPPYGEPKIRNVTSQNSFRSKSDIDTFANQLQSRGIRNIKFLPDNHPGSIPANLKEYAYFRLRASGIIVHNYRPINQCYTMSHNGTTVYIDLNGCLYTHKYRVNALHNMAQLASNIQLYYVLVKPQGYAYGMPSYTRQDAITIFSQYGVVIL